MASILRSLGLGKSKHKKLAENWTDCKQPVQEGITFYCKYLGSTLVAEPSSERITADAIKRIITMAKATGKKLKQVSLTIKPIGIKTCDMNTGEQHLNVSIYRISYCSADAHYDHVIAFIATNSNQTHECHAFLTAKRKIAEAIALTISQAFNIAFERWKKEQEQDDHDKDKVKVNKEENKDNKMLIDFTADENAVPNSDDGFLKFIEQPNNNKKLNSVCDFIKLSQLVKNETKESRKNDQFFHQTDDLFSL